MWMRKELKQRAKEALGRNYWKIMLVAALAMILGGGHAYSSGSSGAGVNSIVAVDRSEDEGESEEIIFGGIVEKLHEAGQERGETAVIVYGVMIAAMILILAIVCMAIIFASTMLLYNPFYVGIQRFMLKSVDGRADVKEVAYGFDHSYKNVVKTMFHADIRVLLWSFLFVIPGIYKKYQYRMVSYILAEHPDIDYREALQMSRDMMEGHKWRTFVLDLSFILWHMLGMITCGMVEILFVNPYVWLTNAALYRKLCGLRDDRERAELTMDGDR